MKKFLLFPCLLLFYFCSESFAQTSFQRLYTFPGAMPMAIAWSVQQTSDGGYILSGFQNKLPPIRAELVKTDASGAVQWSKSYGMKISQFLPTENPITVQSPFCTRQTSDGGYIVCGQLDSRCYLMKLNSTGTTVSWTKQYANNSCGNMVKQTTDGGYIVTGYINDGTKSDSTSIYLAKVTSAGALSWDKTIKVSAVDDDMGNSVVEIAGDGYVVTGYTTQIFGNDTTYDVVLVKTDLNGNHLWTKTYGDDTYSEEGNDVKRLSDGSFIITGYTDESVSGIDGSDVFIIKTNSTGVLSYASAYSMGDADIGERITETSSGYAVMGSTISIFSMSFLDMLLLKTNTSGTPTLGMIYSQSIMHNYMADGQLTSDGGFVMNGWGQLTSMDFLLIKTDANGVSSCNENPVTPVQRSYTPTEASITPTFTAVGASDTRYGLVIDLTVTPSDLCNTVTPLVVDAGNNQSVCVNQTITLGGSPTVSGGTSPYTYTWTPSTYLNNTTVSNPTCTPTSATPATITYTVNVSDNGGGTGSDVVTVTINPLPTVTLSPFTSVCISTAPFALSGGSPSGGTYSGPGVSSNTFSPATAGAGTHVITYTYTDGNGCSNAAAQNLTVSANLTALISGGTTPVCYNSSPGTFTATASGGTAPYSYQWYSTTGIIAGATNSTYSPGNLTTNTGYYCVVSGGPCTPASTTTTNIVVNPALNATISGGTSPICDKTSPGTFTATATGGTGTYTYQWYNAQGLISGATTSTYTAGVLIASNAYYCSVTSNPCGSLYTDTTIIIVIPQVGNPTPITVSAGTDPVCQLANGTTTTTYSTTATNNFGFHWSLSNPLAGTIDSATGVMTWANGFYGTVNIQVIALGCGVPSPMITHTVTVSQAPVAEAGSHTTYTGTPIQIGDPSSGPGTFSWLPAAGLSDPAISQPLASPAATTTYTLTINNNGCIATDTVTITLGGLLGHTISGKTVYAAKSNPGNPVPNLPTYNGLIYAINKVIVVLKNYPSNTELARDTSDSQGNYLFNNVPDGSYLLSYDKYTIDTMQWGNDVTAIDVALLKYFVGSDTLTDPTRCFSAKYKRAANVDNNTTINAVDIARIKAKVGSPFDAVKNFPKGNWPEMNTLVTMAGANLNVTLETVSYGDYNASSSKYRDSLTNWIGAKSLPTDIIVTSDEQFTTNDPYYFELPLKISSKIPEFSAMGLELTYPDNEFKLVSASMPMVNDKNSTVKINPSFEEIVTNDNDLLVTDNDGVIRVVYATTNHFDVAPNDIMIVLGFRSLNSMDRGEPGFKLSGTGVFGNQFGEEPEDAYLLMPKVLVQGSETETGFKLSGYPNPFNNEATITYNIPEDGIVKVKVFNALGELVSELVNENQKSGKHAVAFSQKKLPAGIYTINFEFFGTDKIKCLFLKMIH